MHQIYLGKYINILTDFDPCLHKRVKCTRYTLASISTYWLILTLASKRVKYTRYTLASISTFWPLLSQEGYCTCLKITIIIRKLTWCEVGKGCSYPVQFILPEVFSFYREYSNKFAHLQKLQAATFFMTFKDSKHVFFMPYDSAEELKLSQNDCLMFILIQRQSVDPKKQFLQHYKSSEVWFEKRKKSWKWGNGPGGPLWPTEPPRCLILEDLQTWIHISTNKKLEVSTQYRLLLSFLGGYLSSFKKMFRQREICAKSGEITGLSFV